MRGFIVTLAVAVVLASQAFAQARNRRRCSATPRLALS